MKKSVALFLIVSIILSVSIAFGEAWTCPVCGSINYENFCPRDGSSKPHGSASASIRAGDYISFGHYPQTRSGIDSTPIEWLVLECNDNQALLISRYTLDCQTYGNSRSHTITWENSKIRSWLNSSFYATAFSADERSCIRQTWISCNSNQSGGSWSKGSGGSDTSDYVFLLSRSEADYYFGSDYERRCAPTDYAISRGASAVPNELTQDGLNAGFWWLRTQGNINYSAAIVNTDGSLHRANYYNAADNGVRPVIWLDLSNMGVQVSGYSQQQQSRYNHPEASQFNEYQQVNYALAIEKLATRTGPGTEYDEPGTFNVAGQWIRILAKSYDVNGVCWVKCEIPTSSGIIVAWTGWKRFDQSTLNINTVPYDSY